jgi:hypothetical protein
MIARQDVGVLSHQLWHTIDDLLLPKTSGWDVLY